MALSGTDNKTSFTATASQTTFTFTIPFFDATTVDVSAKKFGDIKVTREAASDGTLTELTPNASPSTVDQFKIAATNNDPSQGCTVTIGAGATANDIYTVERDVKTTQQYDLQEGSTIDPTALNKAFDRIVAQNQQQDDKLNNSITFPATDASTITYNVDSSASSRANKALGFDSSGNITELSLVSAGSVAGNTNAGISVTDNTISATIDTQHMEFNSGNISIKADGITGTEIAGGSITFDLLASNAVTTAKIKDSTSKTDGVTLAKLQHISTDKVLGKLSAGEGDVEEVSVIEDLSSTVSAHTSLATAKAIRETLSGLRVGRVIHIQGTAQSNLTDRIPSDDTEPLITEGAEVCTVDYTPTSTSNFIRMSFEGRIFNNNAGQVMTVAFFEGSTCKQAFVFTQPTSGFIHQSFSFEFNPAATSSTTYSVRVGRESTSGSSNKWGYTAASDPNYNGLKASPTLLVEEWNT